MEESVKENEEKLFEAVKAPNIDEMRRLIEAGTDLNVLDKYFFTSLHYASLRGHFEVVKLLEERGGKSW